MFTIKSEEQPSRRRKGMQDASRRVNLPNLGQVLLA